MENVSEHRRTVLSDDEVDRQKTRLRELRDALTKFGVRSTPANNRQLVLWFTNNDSYRQSGLTAPTLYVFIPSGLVVVPVCGETFASKGGTDLSDDASKAAEILVGATAGAP